jgi:hypothetical protein
LGKAVRRARTAGVPAHYRREAQFSSTPRYLPSPEWMTDRTTSSHPLYDRRGYFAKTIWKTARALAARGQVLRLALVRRTVGP